MIGRSNSGRLRWQLESLDIITEYEDEENEETRLDQLEYDIYRSFKGYTASHDISVKAALYGWINSKREL